MDSPRQSNRREFLRGQSAARSLGDLASQGLAPSASGEAGESESGYLLHVGRQAMACQFQVYLNAGQYIQGTEAALSALDLLGDLEERLSFFRPASRLSGINQHAADGPVEVDPDLFELLEVALRLHAETGGAFDITSTPLWEAWGFARRQGALPSDEQIAEAMPFVGSHLVELDPAHRTVRFLKHGVRLNLGSIGKGYAVDCCARQLLAAGIEHFLIHGGGSSLVARGDRGFAGRSEDPENPAEVEPPAPAETQASGASEDADKTDRDADHPAARSASSPASPATTGWDVGLPHPLRPDRRLGEFRVRDRAVGTSGAQAQSFWHQGRRYGHILDPRTGRPAQNVFSVSVVAPNGALADALSTAFYVMRPDEVLDYCGRHPEIGVVLMCPARRAGGMEVKVVNLTRQELVLWENPPTDWGV